MQRAMFFAGCHNLINRILSNWLMNHSDIKNWNLFTGNQVLWALKTWGTFLNTVFNLRKFSEHHCLSLSHFLLGKPVCFVNYFNKCSETISFVSNFWFCCIFRLTVCTKFWGIWNVIKNFASKLFEHIWPVRVLFIGATCSVLLILVSLIDCVTFYSSC